MECYSFVFEFDALVRTRALVGSGHVWTCIRTGIRIMTFQICIRGGCDCVDVRIRVRVGFPLSVGLIFELDIIKKFCPLVGFLL